MKRIYEFSGKDSGTTDFFSLPTGIIKIHVKSDGGEYSTTTLTLRDLDSDTWIGQFGTAECPFEQQHIMKVEQSDKYLFEAGSNTTWHVWIELME